MHDRHHVIHPRVGLSADWMAQPRLPTVVVPARSECFITRNCCCRGTAGRCTPRARCADWPRIRIPKSLGLTATHPDIAGIEGGSEIECMTKQALLTEILRLPPKERIELLGDAWDTIAASPEDVAIPEWHVQELERRLADPDPEYASWDDVRTRLHGSS